jgi:hypothetical protein
MRPRAAIAGTRDIQAEIRDIPGNTGLLATLVVTPVGLSFNSFPSPFAMILMNRRQPERHIHTATISTNG